MEKYRGTQYRAEIQEFSPHADKIPKTYTFKKTNKGYFAEDLVKWIIEHKLASPNELRLWSFKYEPNGRQTLSKFLSYLKEEIVAEDKNYTKEFIDDDRRITQAILKDISSLEGKLLGRKDTEQTGE